MSFSTTYWALVNMPDGTITGTGQTDPDNQTVPVGAQVVSAEGHGTILAAQEDGNQCRLVNGIVRLIKVPVPAPLDLGSIQQAAYLHIDSEAEIARAAFLTPGSGQALEYQQTAAEAQRLIDAITPVPVPMTGWVSVRTRPPRAHTNQTPLRSKHITVAAAAISIDPANYPWLGAEQAALDSIGLVVTLEWVARQVLATMQGWDTAGAAIKRIRREAKLKVSIATTADAISAILSGLQWPTSALTSGV